MLVRVLYFAGVRQATGIPEEARELPSGATVKTLWRQIAEAHPSLVPWEDRLRFAVNEAFAPETASLSDGDIVALLPPVSGGSGATDAPSAKDPSVRITTDPIEAAALAEPLRDLGEGAVVTFAGVVRPTEGGRPIAGLVYEVYPGMAERQLEAVREETRRRFAVLDVRIAHRHGTVPAGAVAVAIAVAAERREAAFDGCRFAIERLKEIVPVWKSVE